MLLLNHFQSLKQEKSYSYSFSYLANLKIHIFNYIEGFYNSKNPNFANNML